MHIFTSVWSAQHPNASQNIQQSEFPLLATFLIENDGQRQIFNSGESQHIFLIVRIHKNEFFGGIILIVIYYDSDDSIEGDGCKADRSHLAIHIQHSRSGGLPTKYGLRLHL